MWFLKGCEATAPLIFPVSVPIYPCFPELNGSWPLGDFCFLNVVCSLSFCSSLRTFLQLSAASCGKALRNVCSRGLERDPVSCCFPLRSLVPVDQIGDPISSVGQLVRSEIRFQELTRQSHGCAILVESHLPSACVSVAVFPVFSTRASLHVSKLGPVSVADGAQLLELHERSALEVCWQGTTTAQKTPHSPTLRGGAPALHSRRHGEVTELWVHPGWRTGAANLLRFSAPSLDTRLPASRE